MHELMITTPVEFKTYCENIVQQKKQDHERMLKKREKYYTYIENPRNTFREEYEKYVELYIQTDVEKRALLKYPEKPDNINIFTYTSEKLLTSKNKDE